MPRQFWIRREQAIEGPLSVNELRELAASGTLREDHYISSDGSKWVRARNVRGLAFGSLDRSETTRASSDPDATSAWDDDEYRLAADQVPESPLRVDDLLTEAELQPRHETLVAPTRPRGEPGKRAKSQVTRADRKPVVLGGVLLLGSLGLLGLLVNFVLQGNNRVFRAAEQEVIEATVVSAKDALHSAVLLQEDPDGDDLLVRLEFDRDFISQDQAIDSSLGSYVVVRPDDFKLITVGEEMQARAVSLDEPSNESVAVSCTMREPDAYHDMLPRLNSFELVANGTLRTETVAGETRTRGSIDLRAEGEVEGLVTVKPRHKTSRLTHQQSMDGYGLLGSFNTTLPDETPITFQYDMQSCTVTWSNKKWTGLTVSRDSTSKKLEEGLLADSTVVVTCLFERPAASPALGIRFRNHKVLALDPELCSPSK